MNFKTKADCSVIWRWFETKTLHVSIDHHTVLRINSWCTWSLASKISGFFFVSIVFFLLVRNCTEPVLSWLEFSLGFLNTPTSIDRRVSSPRRCKSRACGTRHVARLRCREWERAKSQSVCVVEGTKRGVEAGSNERERWQGDEREETGVTPGEPKQTGRSVCWRVRARQSVSCSEGRALTLLKHTRSSTRVLLYTYTLTERAIEGES